jgi:hypothetical protein
MVEMKAKASGTPPKFAATPLKVRKAGRRSLGAPGESAA